MDILVDGSISTMLLDVVQVERPPALLVTRLVVARGRGKTSHGITSDVEWIVKMIIVEVLRGPLVPCACGVGDGEVSAAIHAGGVALVVVPSWVALALTAVCSHRVHSVAVAAAVKTGARHRWDLAVDSGPAVVAHALAINWAVAVVWVDGRAMAIAVAVWEA